MRRCLFWLATLISNDKSVSGFTSCMESNFLSISVANSPWSTAALQHLKTWVFSAEFFGKSSILLGSTCLGAPCLHFAIKIDNSNGREQRCPLHDRQTPRVAIAQTPKVRVAQTLGVTKPNSQSYSSPNCTLSDTFYLIEHPSLVVSTNESLSESIH